MSESLAKERPSIDMDGFERQLRHPQTSQYGNDDPLAELARLVGEHHDPYGDVFAQESNQSSQPAHDPSLYATADHHGYERREPAFGTPAESPRLSGNFAAIEAGLRGALSAHPEAAHPIGAAEHEFFAQQEAYAQGEAYPASQHDYAPEQWAAPPQPGIARSPAGRGRRPVYAVAATIAVGVIGIGVAFAFKGPSSSPSAIRTIEAASGPTKIEPPAEAANDQTGQDSAMLGKKGADAPTQLVSREEQPVDLSQAVQENKSRNADAGTAAPGDASNVPVPPAPSQAAQGADQMGFGIGMPAPKRVKVVSVRPDGTILPNDAPPSAALPAQRQVASAESQDPIARASTPRAEASETPKSASKSTARVGAAPRHAKADADDDAPVAKPKQRVASAEPNDDATASVPHSGGGFAVQLAAPGSEADARSASSRLAKKFSAALAGYHLAFHKAQSNGKSVYRVRVGKLSKEDATGLCGKLKADGGSCFVAKN